MRGALAGSGLLCRDSCGRTQGHQGGEDPRALGRAAPAEVQEKGAEAPGRQQRAGGSAAVAEGPGRGNAGVVTPGTERDKREGALGGITRALLAGRGVSVFRMPAAGCTAQAPEEGEASEAACEGD